ncbi:hypothetical protein J6590_053380 [Homalodisca vitripennis]|nr:hypothetical protein J6590_053380 [Homalodisca vitripennis]
MLPNLRSAPTLEFTDSGVNFTVDRTQLARLDELSQIVVSVVHLGFLYRYGVHGVDTQHGCKGNGIFPDICHRSVNKKHNQSVNHQSILGRIGFQF